MTQNFLVENLKFQRNTAMDGLAMCSAENVALRAEVERLTALNKALAEQLEQAIALAAEPTGEAP
jgi:hypothetical protein